MAEDDVAADALIHEAVVTAISGYFYSDSLETPEHRANRLSTMFTPGARELTDAPLFTPDAGYQSVTEGRILDIETTWVYSDTTAQVVVGVTWSVVWWPLTGGGEARTYGGDNTILVDIEHHDGMWLVASMNLND